MIDLTLPIKTISENNQREHWAKRHRRRKKQRADAYLGMHQVSRPERTDALTIGLTRIAPRKLDSDNLSGSCKAVRDGISDWLGIDDGDPRLVFRYREQRGKPKEYAVRVQIVEWQISHPWPGDE